MRTALAPTLLFLLAPGPLAAGGEPFAVEVVDARTGRGVPLVELRTTHNLRYYTDSAGIAAVDAPELMGHEVYFFVSGHGYEFPADGFGYRGKRLRVEPGGHARVELLRVNVAERLYRVTGGGIYADSVRVGREAPIDEPLLNGLVFGQDSVFTIPYRGKLWWFWGDTNRPGYPLGNFHMSGATSDLPGEGGLDPEIGVNLRYFVDDDGFSREMARLPGDGPTWLSGFVVLPDAEGRERLYAGYAKIKPPLETYERGLCAFDDEAGRFDRVAAFPGPDALSPLGHALRLETGDGTPHVHFATPYPLVRVPADAEAMADPARYESFTCLEPGGESGEPRVDRDAEGRPVFRWRAGAPVLGPKDQAELIKSGALAEGEGLLNLLDVETGEAVFAHAGTVFRNEHRGRWVLIATQLYGESVLGEIWYAEADSPLGPWAFARRVVSHDKYSFYNPMHHVHFDADGGRRIFFEGTYTQLFSGAEFPTPRYDYNQIMYRLDLDDPRLNLPVAFYRVRGDDGAERLGPIAALGDRPAEGTVAFFALDRPGEDTVPVSGAGGELRIDHAADPLFHALPADADDPPAASVPLFAFRDDAGRFVYATSEQPPRDGLERVGGPICRVWRRPGPERQPLFP